MTVPALRAEKSVAPSSDELIKRFQHDQNGCWIYQLIQQYEALIRRYEFWFTKSRLSREDIHQELFLHLAQRLKGAVLHTNSKGWLAIVIKNFLVDLFKKEKRRMDIEKEYPTKYDPQYQPDIEVDLEVLQVLTQARNILTDQQYACLYLFYLKDQSYKQIAKQLHMTTKQVDNTLRVAKMKLRRAFQLLHP